MTQIHTLKFRGPVSYLTADFHGNRPFPNTTIFHCVCAASQKHRCGAKAAKSCRFACQTPSTSGCSSRRARAQDAVRFVQKRAFFCRVWGGRGPASIGVVLGFAARLLEARPRGRWDVSGAAGATFQTQLDPGHFHPGV